ncbi:hypothetical protein HAX54_005302 [Datura stramonium]|uniref:Uncharacterized protein n=1 Tax=Datura stramonium TaxID=4076 RepID=A0ABS8RUF7_DATST|nr:hypothetical protein [Datura stramonium]
MEMKYFEERSLRPTPIDENSYGNQVNSEDEHSEYDSDYGEKQESDSEEDLDEEFEECDSSDEEALIDAFADSE